MGDILHALPAVTALRQAHPGWVIDWVVEPRWRALLAGQEAAEDGLHAGETGEKHTWWVKVAAGKPTSEGGFPSISPAIPSFSGASTAPLLGGGRSLARPVI